MTLLRVLPSQTGQQSWVPGSVQVRLIRGLEGPGLNRPSAPPLPAPPVYRNLFAFSSLSGEAQGFMATNPKSRPRQTEELREPRATEKTANLVPPGALRPAHRNAPWSADRVEAAWCRDRSESPCPLGLCGLWVTPVGARNFRLGQQRRPRAENHPSQFSEDGGGTRPWRSAGQPLRARAEKLRAAGSWPPPGSYCALSTSPTSPGRS